MNPVVEPRPALGTATSASRMSWVDLARALSIVLVVSYHAGVSGVATFLPPELSITSSYWREANLLLVPLRMPLFFVVSGMLAANALSRPWGAVSRPRVFDLLWAYLLWSVVFGATAWVRYAPEEPGEYFLTSMQNMMILASPYWFIAALPVFFLLTRWCRSRPILLLTALFLVYLVSPLLVSALRDMGPGFSRPAAGLSRLTEFAVWFAAGYVLSRRIREFGARARPSVAVLAVSVSIPMCWLAVRGDLETGTERIVTLLATVSSVLAVLSVSVLLGTLPTISRLGKLLGSRTLVIYLVHPLVLNVLVVVCWRVYGQGTGPVPLAVEVFLLPTIVLLCVLISLGFKAVTDRLGADWLFQLPGGARQKSPGAVSSMPVSRYRLSPE